MTDPGKRRPGSTVVARAAGVSQKTVSRVFNNEPNVSEQTRARVLAAARQLGYRPNSAARALLTGRHHRIGVVSLGTTHFGPSSLLVALERAARRISYSLTVANSFEEEPSGLEAAIDNLLTQGVDAIILSEPVDETDGPLVIDVPVLTLGAAPEVQAPVVLSVHAAEGWAWSHSGNGLISTVVPINFDSCKESRTTGDCASTDWTGSLGFKSPHPGGAHFVMGDASVHFLPDAIDMLMYNRLGGKADGGAARLAGAASGERGCCELAALAARPRHGGAGTTADPGSGPIAWISCPGAS